MLKAFITAVENSNNGYTFDWKKEVDQLKGKKVGLIFGLEEYTKQDGSTGTVTKLNQFRSIDKVDNALIPRVKLLDGTFVEYEEYNSRKQENKTNDPFKDYGDVVEIDDNFLD
jgi:DNA integrity scanning protein DisA with diadenylate cyclase activity